MNIERNGEYTVNELNSLLSTNHWEVNELEKLEQARKYTWGWITARNEQNVLIGFVRILSDDIYHAYIHQMIVNPDYQGNGIGTAIMKEVMKMIGERHLVPTLVAAPGKKKFYEKFGFTTESNGCIAMCIRKPFWKT